MSFIDKYYTDINENSLSVSGEQGSCFAKQVANDFNPIHHADSRRFCVPGDLLFAIALTKYGIHERMSFRFLDLLSANTPVSYPLAVQPEIMVESIHGKPTLGINLVGNATHQGNKIESLIRKYVAFSGHNFPDILVPLMRAENVMINPQRPLVIYQSMTLEMSSLEFDAVSICLAETSLTVKGKRGDCKLEFDITYKGQNIGHGVKTLILSGLREYQEDSIQAMRDEYARSKLHGLAGKGARD